MEPVRDLSNVSLVRTLIPFMEGPSQCLSGEESACNAGKAGGVGSALGGEDPTRHIPHAEEEMEAHSSMLAGESYGRRSLAAYSPWGCRGSDTTE